MKIQSGAATGIKACLAYCQDAKAYRIVIALFIALLFVMTDFLSYLQWWLTLLGLGLIFFPLTSVFFGKFTSKGYIFSKAVGLAIAGYMTWLLASIKIL
ncbi:MAG: hypothetical protein LBT44_01440, partial [Clostridiales bacterium]|nr:hypothetical protein [Clostridiales bacterium]